MTIRNHNLDSTNIRGLESSECLSSKRRKDPHCFEKLGPCNTSEMTLGRVLGLALGILFDYEDHGREDRQSFESATMGRKFENPTVSSLALDRQCICLVVLRLNTIKLHQNMSTSNQMFC